MHHLACSVHAGVGASCRHTQGRPRGIEFPQGLFKGLLHAGAVGLALPALKGAAVVLQAESDPAQGLQTNSMIAISALSPRRGTVRMMRV
jgi:hypothetical protein